MISRTRRPLTESERKYLQDCVARIPYVPTPVTRRPVAGIVAAVATAPVLVIAAVSGLAAYPPFWGVVALYVTVVVLAAGRWRAGPRLDQNHSHTRFAEALDAGEAEVLRYSSRAVVRVLADPIEHDPQGVPHERGEWYEDYYDLGDGHLVCFEAGPDGPMPNSEIDVAWTANNTGVTVTPCGERLTPLATITGEAAAALQPLRPYPFEAFPGSLKTLADDLRAYWDRRRATQQARDLAAAQGAPWKTGMPSDTFVTRSFR